MAGKGDGRRKAQIKRVEEDLKWELSKDSTPKERKEELKQLFTIKQTFQQELADITTTESRKEILRKIMDGELPYGLEHGTRKCIYFPWSERYEENCLSK